MPLGDQFGLAMPMGEAFATFNLPGGGAIAGVWTLHLMDCVTLMAVVLHKLPLTREQEVQSNKSQNLRIAAAKQKDQVQKLVGSEVEKQKAKLFLGAEDAFSDEGNRAIGRMIEGNATAADMKMRQDNKQ